ncbi:DUF262 domain-containing protein [Plesiomonas shigelloides]|uniref:DUF262 domain-containing protein n=1 Tax=Plesiomonas shigelloides TaxID=703 RepID=UPI001261874C|nr:DUF262 domain-containing protein [Plesiomonas shigelloides]KAB7653189.1 DUF262 domain-containing protein [Plesiomonas shigelloides]
MQKSLEIFKAEPQSVFDVICQQKNTGFYMPSYQRAYSWEESHIKDLFSDCENVFRNLLHSSNAIIFLGTILSVDDSKALTIYPISKKQQLPTHIKLVIDGQQRLSTLMLIILCLNERLNILLPHLKSAINSEQDENIKDVLSELRQVVSQLEIDTSNTAIETTAEHDVFKYLPKIIRSQVDCWGQKENNALYDSPIADVLFSYKRHTAEQRENSVFKEFDLKNLASKRVSNNIKEIRKQLDCIQKGFEFKSSDGELEKNICINDLVDIETLDICLDLPITKDLQLASERHPKIEGIIYIAAFTKFLLHRVCLTYVEVNNESYAFDMFEALNTTGEPLTALETFVPKVIEHIRNKRNNGCTEEELETSMSVLNSITSRFEVIIDSKEKNNKTKAMILAFVRAYQGKVKITRLRDQRDAMLKSYEDCHYLDKDEYLTQLAVAADFLFDHWQAASPDLGNLVSISERDIANLCLRYLVDMNHDIVQSILIQYLLLDKKYETLGTEHSSFMRILKAVTAFSVLWRTMSGGADGIDAVYKKLHERGITGNDDSYQLANSGLNSNRFNVDTVIAFFRQELEAKIISKGSPKNSVFEQWLDICSKQQILTRPKNIKLLLLASMHGIELDGINYKISEECSNKFLTTMMWELVSNKFSIKKVFNSDVAKDWSDEAITHPEEFNKIGNVLIDPRNGISSNIASSWYNLKQHMLQALANESIKNIDDIFKASGNITEEAKRNLSVLMIEKRFTDITFAEEWNKLAIDERSVLLLSNAWRNLTQWIDWE